jgi:hypothetical protein
LSENPPSDLTNDTFFKTNKQFSSALGAAYRQLSGWATGSIRDVNEVSTDEMVIPQRGQDWYDGGTHILMQRQTWTFKSPKVEGAWGFSFGGVSTTNRLIYQFNQFIKEDRLSEEEGKSFVSELKVLRAFYYYLLLDEFGNVPIIKKFKGAPVAPANNNDFQAGRDKLFNFVESQIKNNIQNLTRTPKRYRMNVWAAHALLAKLYLNAKVYIGKPMWKEALAQADSIINSNNYRLASDYLSMFSWNNQNTPGFIFAIPYDEVFFQGNNWASNTLHYLNQQTYNLQYVPNNGYCTIENFYNSFKDNDTRRGGLLIGYQYDSKGNHLFDASAFKGTPHGDTLYFTPHINELQPRAFRNAGARFIKYKPNDGTSTNQSNDAPIFRYADVLLMKAECLWRLHKDPSVALHLVNKVRERAGLSDYGSLSAYKILKERGHEFYAELWRRQDLIRFKGGMHYHYKPNGVRETKYPAGKTAFNDAWWAKKITDPHVNVFPIPQDQMNSNKNLNQNPDY